MSLTEVFLKVRFEKLYGFFSQYFFSLLTGVISLIALIYLAQLFPAEKSKLSQITNILNTFPLFFFFLDMGSSAEFFRQRSLNDPNKTSSFLILLRFFLSILLVFIIWIYALVSGFEGDILKTFLCFAFSFLGYGLLSAVDTILVSENRVIQANTTRLARILSVLILMAVFTLVPDVPLSLAFSLASGVVILTTVMCLRFFIKIQWSFAFHHAQINFIKNSFFQAAPSLVVMIFSVCVSALLMRTIGINHLFDYSAALMVGAVCTLAMQSINTVFASNIAENSHNVKDTFQLLKKISIYHLLSFILFCFLISVFFNFGLIGFFIPQISREFLTYVFLFLFSQLLANIQTPFIQWLNYSDVKISLVVVYLLASGLSFLTLFPALERFDVYGYFLSFNFFWLLTFVMIVSISKMKKDSLLKSTLS